jgi:hypothetical protein
MVLVKHLEHFPYVIALEREISYDARLWCENQFGPMWNQIKNQNGIWYFSFGGPKTGNYYAFEWFFLNEQHIMLFSLRWS